MPRYTIASLPGDMLAAFSVVSISIPQSISYATFLSGLSPLAGLFATILPATVYAFLGTSRHLNVAPEASLCLLIGQTISSILNSEGNMSETDRNATAIAITTIITFQVGILTLILGILRLGFVDVILSRALLRAFINAIVIVILIEQAVPMLGLGAIIDVQKPKNSLDKLIRIVQNLDSSHAPTTRISLATLVAIILLQLVKKYGGKHPLIKRMPDIVLVVVGFTALSSIYRWTEQGVAVFGSVPITLGKSFFSIPIRESTMRYFEQTTPIAIMISIIGYFDSIIAGKQNATRFNYLISPNRELVALGAGNLAVSFIPGTLPAYGSLIRSRICADSGGTSQMTSLVCSLIVAFVTFSLLPLLYHLPRCVLAAVICVVVFHLLQEAPHSIMHYWRMRAWRELALMGVTLVCTMLWSVEMGVAMSVGFSLLLLVQNSSRARLVVLGRVPGTEHWEPETDGFMSLEHEPGTLVVQLKDNLDFANTSQLKERLRRLEMYGQHSVHPSEPQSREEDSVLILHLGDVDDCDADAVLVLHELFASFKSRGADVYLTNVSANLRDRLERGGIINLIGAHAIFPSVSSAVSSLPSRMHVRVRS
ncbi:sulfate permease [Schizopora paradoxa]|uniref:Sulfate permease n=1 Tax=Schizopora paradoxa TaxID=27342 RepID=A0A0H2RSW1_9AGAM|nr:sulfate permease [Schizopora paradoxa]